MIPRLIHQTWKSSEVPPSLRSYYESWRKHHPDFEVKLWSDEDNERLVQDEFPELLELYRGLSRGVHRADLARCLYLLKFGGLYVDLDIECLGPVDELLAEAGECAIGCEPRVHAERLQGVPRLVCNAAMASVPGHPFWREMIDEIKRRAGDKSKSDDPVWTTGPVCLNHVQKQHGDRLGVTVWEPDVFFPLPDYDSAALALSDRERAYFKQMVRFGYYPSATRGVHHWAHTWIPGSDFRGRVRNKVRRLAELKHFISGEKTIDEVVRTRDYQVEFPEARFVVSSKKRPEHDEKVRIGGRHAKKSRVAIATLIHNRLDIVMSLRARLSRLAENFEHAEIFVLGEDSTDGTEKALWEWQKSEPELVQSVAAPDLSECSGAFHRMAKLRNSLLEAVSRRGQETEPFDYLIMIDGDLNGPTSDIGLQHAFALLKEGACAVAAFGINNWGAVPLQVPYVGYSYYDALAYREHSFERTQKDGAIRWRLGREKRGSAPFEVKSAFGGLCIYRADAIVGLRYPLSNDDCEHVLFHRLLAEAGHSILLDPSFLLLAGKQGHHVAKT